MQRLVLLFATGCAWGVQAGALGVSASRGGPSGEAVLAVGGGLGSKESTLEGKLVGTLGAASPNGGVQGRGLGGFEYIAVETSPGGQAELRLGGCVRARPRPPRTAE